MATAGTRQGSCRMREPVSSRTEFLKLGLGGAPALPALSACGGGTLGQIEGGSGSLTLLLDHTSSEVQRFQRVVDQFQKQSPGISVTVGNIADGSAFYIKINTEGVAKDLPDVWYARTFDVEYDALRGWAAPLDSYITKTSGFDMNDFWPTLQPDEVKREFLYAALEPFRLCHFVNQSMLKASKVPLPSPDWDRAEFESIASVFRRPFGSARTRHHNRTAARKQVRRH
jgi:multiple sugar transport system substrate-binding protein